MSLKNNRFVAIVLAAGQGKRMKTSTSKQYLLLDGKPVLYYALNAFEKSIVDEVILVTGENEILYCQEEIVQKYGFQKVSRIVKGGDERYKSVFCGLEAVNDAEYVLIHDGARPFIDNDMIKRVVDGVKEFKACVVGMPSKDTVKIADENGFLKFTPNRKDVWIIQTPQAFSYSTIYKAYKNLIDKNEINNVTDDAMVLEQMNQIPIKFIEGSYKNIKITTPEDLEIASVFCKKYS